jgi:tRNA-splicing ligase RtcB
MSRTQAFKQWHGRELVDQLEKQGIYIRSGSFRGIAEEAPDAYKDIHKVVQAAEDAGLAARVAYLKPLICVKG